MNDPSSAAVRPTKRALDNLGLRFPPLEEALESLDDAVVAHAQRIPELVDADGAERIVSLTDRVWFKVKTGDKRGAVTRFNEPLELNEMQLATSSWWLGAAGRRKDDSVTDFYTALQQECEQAASGTSHATNSEHLLPQSVDVKRWAAEVAARVNEELHRLVRAGIARSARDGYMWRAELQNSAIGALVRGDEGETYVAISAEGYRDPKLLAVILSAVPGIAAEDWQVEPGKVLGIEPHEGQLIWSTLLPAASLAALLDAAEQDENHS